MVSDHGGFTVPRSHGWQVSLFSGTAPVMLLDGAVMLLSRGDGSTGRGWQVAAPPSLSARSTRRAPITIISTINARAHSRIAYVCSRRGSRAVGRLAALAPSRVQSRPVVSRCLTRRWLVDDSQTTRRMLVFGGWPCIQSAHASPTGKACGTTMVERCRRNDASVKRPAARLMRAGTVIRRTRVPLAGD